MMVALASRGVRLMPSIPSTMAPATTKTKKRQTLATTPDMVATRALVRVEPVRLAAWLATRSRTRRMNRLPSRATISAIRTTIRMLSGRTIKSVTVDAVSGVTPSLMRRW